MARLQFLHRNDSLENREEAIAYLDGLTLSSKMGEPIVVSYKEGETLHAILAIGKQTSESPISTFKYEYIDADNIAKQIKALSENTAEQIATLSGSTNERLTALEEFHNKIFDAKLCSSNYEVSPETGEITEKGEDDDKKDVLVLVYEKTTTDNPRKFESISIPLGSFLLESEFKSGLTVTSANGEVSVDVQGNSGLQIGNDNDKNAVSVKVKVPTSATTKNTITDKGKNFLSIEGENGLSVLGVDTDASVTTKDILIAGFNSNQVGAGEYAEGDTIEAGTSVQDILTKLLSKELWNSNTISETYKFTASCEQPTFTITPQTTCEVGDKITISNISAGTSQVTANSYEVGDFEYGYTFDTGDTKSYVEDKKNGIEYQKYKKTLDVTTSKSTNEFNVSFSNFIDGNGNVKGSVTDISSSIEVYAREGANKVTVSQTGFTFYTTGVTAQKFYIKTNIGNHYQKDNKENDNIYSAKGHSVDSKSTTSRKEVTVNAYYKVYTGFTAYADNNGGDAKSYANVFTSKSDVSTKLNSIYMSSNTITIDSMKSSSETPNLVIVMPNAYKLTGLQNSAAFPEDPYKNFRLANTFTYTNNTSSIEYQVLILAADKATEYLKIKISKS